MTVKVYVAGASKEIQRAQLAIEALKAGGVTVTSTWPTVISNIGESNPTDATKEQYSAWVQVDLAEVLEADILFLLLPAIEIVTVGAYVELGCAATAHKAIYTVGPHRPIFTPGLSTKHFGSDDEAIRAIVGLLYDSAV